MKRELRAGLLANLLREHLPSGISWHDCPEQRSRDNISMKKLAGKKAVFAQQASAWQDEALTGRVWRTRAPVVVRL